MQTLSFTLNGKKVSIQASSEIPLLWALRDILHMTGTKYGCGAALCGACTVHLDGGAVRSCSTPLSVVAGKKITTIEGLSPDGTHPLQLAWIEENVAQCGYCQAGQIMQAASLLKQKPHPTDDEINTAMSGNLCRCGTYPRVRKAIHLAASGKYSSTTKRGAKGEKN
ncbi:MAG: (2Fe-2S)-binding protein [Candidatus Kapabacteria bacterium]|jgi:isoquinoline 1-oxidoreductase alpha subunit|nr:(2Fe-2S)-binding protein [Candidatus Kapabacteria bacterium]